MALGGGGGSVVPVMPWEVIASNIAEAREQLQKIEARISRGAPPNESEFQIMMQHAYHHLNFAWNMRNHPVERYAQLSQEDFERWGTFPDDLAFEDA
jgi:hypothetical protein